MMDHAFPAQVRDHRGLALLALIERHSDTHVQQHVLPPAQADLQLWHGIPRRSRSCRELPGAYTLEHRRPGPVPSRRRGASLH